MSLASQARVEDPFETPEMAVLYLEKNIGTFMACIVAAGSAKIDLIDLTLQSRDLLTNEALNKSRQGEPGCTG
jgi:hypothetical protein